MPMIPHPSTHENIALLIDADNAPAAKIDFIIAELATHGVVSIRRAYGNWTKSSLSGWRDILHEYAIQPMQHFDLVKGKNATDMALLIEAMDILYTKNVGTFALVSSDCDFTPLILRLRAEGKQVIGFGGQKTPAPFVASCSRFLYLDEDKKSEEVRKEKATDPTQLKGDTKLMNLLRKAVEATADEDGWAALGPVGSHISNQGSFDPRNHGFSQLSGLFSAIDLFEVHKGENGNGTTIRVRYKRRPKRRPRRSRKDARETVHEKSRTAGSGPGFCEGFLMPDQAVAASSSSSKCSRSATTGSGSSTVNSNSAVRWWSKPVPAGMR